MRQASLGYAQTMLKRAMGWLRWEPDVALNTPFPLIQLALDGFIETRGGGSKSEDGEPKDVAGKVRRAFDGMIEAGGGAT